MPATTRDPTTRPRTTAKQRWSRPRIQCLDSRPEVTAYAGAGDGPWWTVNR